jgi:L-threonylcarbamoyladenylate synthase
MAGVPVDRLSARRSTVRDGGGASHEDVMTEARPIVIGGEGGAMTIVRGDEGLRRLGEALAGNVPVVLPLPVPLPYVVAGSGAGPVNVAKGRPAGQAVGVVVADFAMVAPFVELDRETLAFARWLSARELVNVLLPVGDGGPEWMRPSTAKGWLALMLGWFGHLRPLLDEWGHLYVSSANRTGGEVAVTSAAANTAFDDELLVLDGDELRDQSVVSGSAAMVRIGSRRRVEVVRHGVHGAAFAGDTDRFLRELNRRWDNREGT